MRTVAILASLVLLLAAASPFLGTADAQVTKTVDPAEMTFGFMNVFELDCTSYVFGTGWGFGDLVASFSGDTLCLSPNTVGDACEFWYQCSGGESLGCCEAGGGLCCGAPGAPGNKCMEAIAHAQVMDGSLAGQTLTFAGEVYSNTWSGAHATQAFIREFAPGFGSIIGETYFDLTTTGAFSISQGITGVGGPVQWGFITRGPNVWAGDEGPFGSLKVGPEPPVSTESTTWGQIKSTYDE